MKKIYKDKILNIPETEMFDGIFVFEYFSHRTISGVSVVYLRDELQKYKNEEILEQVKQKPAMYSEVYSPKDELEIFTQLFEAALLEKKKIHIVWVTLTEEIEMLEDYYTRLGFMREDINCFDVDFWVPLVTVSCHIENLMWKGSDYKAQKEAIFFCPPIRESGQNKALFKWITRGVIAGIELENITPEKEKFLWDCIREEKILPLHMWKVLSYNLSQIGFEWEKRDLHIQY